MKSRFSVNWISDLKFIYKEKLLFKLNSVLFAIFLKKKLLKLNNKFKKKKMPKKKVICTLIYK
jgi:hypothetical protein